MIIDYCTQIQIFEINFIKIYNFIINSHLKILNFIGDWDKTNDLKYMNIKQWYNVFCMHEIYSFFEAEIKNSEWNKLCKSFLFLFAILICSICYPVHNKGYIIIFNYLKSNILMFFKMLSVF